MGLNKIESLHVLTIIVVISAVFCVNPPPINNEILTRNQPVGECQACRLFIESFKKGLERTARGKYEGGDAAWEEEKLKKSYKRSEMRLIDIQEGICKEETKHSVHCHHMAEKAEEYIEEWWAQNADDSEDLFSYICIDKMKVCCPKHHYGKDCTPCPDNLCSGNGKCRGDGTRKGNGTCLCDPGYTGKNCDSCDTGYYLSYKDDNKMLCSKCHHSCMGGCKHGTPKDCAACKPGFKYDPDEGCIDMNECNSDHTCSKDQFCVNTVGSVRCVDCYKSCDGCYGDGPDMCRECKQGYSKQGDLCLPNTFEQETEPLTQARFITYGGLLVATCVLLPKSAHLGGFVGFLAISYIIGAEYYCMINGHTGLVDLKQFDLSRLVIP